MSFLQLESRLRPLGRGVNVFLARRRAALRLRAVGGNPGVLLAAAAVGVVDSVAAVLRHVHLQSGFDLAIFDQAVWHYSRFEAPFSSIKGENLLGDHFHPLVALLAPLYWAWSDPRMLLIAQGVLVGASIIPVFVFARRRMGAVAAYLAAAAYGMFWGLQVGVLFDFHEVAFAPLLIALAILLSDLERWRLLWLDVILLLLVKEDLSILVAFFGLLLLWRGHRRHGLLLALLGVGWYALVTGVLIPHFNAHHDFTYWSYSQLGPTPAAAASAVLRAPWRLVTVGLSPAVKAHTIIALFAPFLFLSLGSRWVLLAVPLLAERFLSSNANLWGTHYHYSMAIAPVVAMSAIAGAANLRGLVARRWPRGRVQQLLPVALAGAMLLTGAVYTIHHSRVDSVPSRLRYSSFYPTPPYAPAAYRALAHLPAAASLTTVNATLSHASRRPDIVALAPGSSPTRYLLVNVLQERCCGGSGSTDNETTQVLGQLIDRQLLSMTPVFYDGGWLLAEAPAPEAHAARDFIQPPNGRGARSVAAKVREWQLALGHLAGQFFQCAQLRRTRDSRSSACFASLLPSLTPAQQRLTRALVQLASALHGACADLDHRARAASHILWLDIAHLSAAGALPTDSGYRAAYSQLQTHVANDDLTNPPQLFAQLCTSR